ncbi:hypothetical protein [Streptosporangium saharense]|uniref:hypothetical protein n=1 Tax=Streptosporangium saharense TaxID=1706840 RepID=UPI0036C6C107
MALPFGGGKSGTSGHINKIAPTPPVELLFEIATRARLAASPLTTDLGPDDGLPIEEAIAIVLSPAPVTPLLSDPELAIVAKVAEDDPDYAETLRAGIAAFRADLAAQAEQIGDAQLSAHLLASATAAAEFDADAHTLPFPEDDDIELVIDAVNQQVAQVNNALADATTEVSAQVIHQTILRTLRTASPAVPVPSRSADTAPLVRRVEEATAITRLSTRDSQAQQAAATLTLRLYWQDETLQQALDALAPPPADTAPTKSVLVTSGPNPATTNVAALVTAIHLDYLAFSLGVSRGIGTACAQRVAKTPPVADPVSQAPQQVTDIPPWERRREIFGDDLPLPPNIYDRMADASFLADHVYNPATKTWRRLTPREKIIRNWGVAGALTGWVGGSAVGVLLIPETGGTAPFILQFQGLVAGARHGMEFGEWVADTYYPELR